MGGFGGHGSGIAFGILDDSYTRIGRHVDGEVFGWAAAPVDLRVVDLNVSGHA